MVNWKEKGDKNEPWLNFLAKFYHYRFDLWMYKFFTIFVLFEI